MQTPSGSPNHQYKVQTPSSRSFPRISLPSSAPSQSTTPKPVKYTSHHSLTSFLANGKLDLKLCSATISSSLLSLANRPSTIISSLVLPAAPKSPHTSSFHPPKNFDVTTSQNPRLA